MATNPYTAPSISSYNSSPPPDDGAETSANTVEWAKHKDKLSDPIKTLAETDITNTTAAFAKVINTDANEDNAMAGALAFTASTLTISSGSVAATRSHHIIAAETGTTDDLANITTAGVSDGAYLVIRADTGDTITVKDAATGAGEIHMDNNADYALSNDLSLTLQRRGTDWYEISRSAKQKAIAGELVQVIQKDIAEQTNTTTTPAIDTSIPLASEGVEIVTQAITLRDASSRLKVTLSCFLSHTTADGSVFAIFRGSTCIGAAAFHVNAADRYQGVNMVIVDSPASASELTYSIRWGVGASTGHLNKATGGSLFGGAVNIANGITLEEIAG